MSPYITFRDTDKRGDLQLFVLQRDFPHFCAILSSHPIADPIAQVPISGHNLWLVYSGTIRGNYIPSFPDAQEQIQSVLELMGSWFYENRILTDQKRYKKWLIPMS